MNMIRVKYTKWFNIMKSGLKTDNPVYVAALGLCSALAISNTVENAIAMGLGVTFVIIVSSVFVSLFRNYIPSKLRIVTYMVIISTFTIFVQKFLQAYFPDIYSSLGAYVGLIITNCIVMGRAEAFAVKNPWRYSLIDGFASGMGYMFVLILVALIREPLAFGTILGYQVMPAGFKTWASMAIAPGGFFILGLIIWVLRNWAKSYDLEV
jgi:Na+-transporting NADH:ubiquinone oxidoreductase subunit D